MVRASASGAVGRGFTPWPRHIKGDKPGTGSSLSDARNKRVVPGRYKKAGGYPLFVMSQLKLYRADDVCFKHDVK